MHPYRRMLHLLAIAGNILFVLWILANGINENFEGTPIEKFSYISLMMLLLLNAVLLYRSGSNAQSQTPV